MDLRILLGLFIIICFIYLCIEEKETHEPLSYTSTFIPGDILFFSSDKFISQANLTQHLTNFPYSHVAIVYEYNELNNPIIVMCKRKIANRTIKISLKDYFNSNPGYKKNKIMILRPKVPFQINYEKFSTFSYPFISSPVRAFLLKHNPKSLISADNFTHKNQQIYFKDKERNKFFFCSELIMCLLYDYFRDNELVKYAPDTYTVKDIYVGLYKNKLYMDSYMFSYL